MDNTSLIKMLEYIDPASCDYQEWVNVGMAAVSVNASGKALTAMLSL